MNKPKPTNGLRHVALFVKNFEACEHFYTALVGLAVDWRPDADNVYLSSGHDNLALHRAAVDFSPAPHQHLDHIGFFLDERNEVDTWFEYLSKHGVTIKAAPREHRDGTRSFYCTDPDGNVVQFIYYPINNK